MPETIVQLNHALFYLVNHATALLPDELWASITMLGDGSIILLACAPLLFYQRRQLLAVMLSVPWNSLLSHLGKTFIDSPRPPAVLPLDTFHIIGRALGKASMPSGHTVTAFAVITAIAFAATGARRQAWRWLLAVAVLVALSRIAMGVHWPLDVLVGALLGMFCGGLGLLMLNRLPASLWQTARWPLHLYALLVFIASALVVLRPNEYEGPRLVQWLFIGLGGLGLAVYWRQLRIEMQRPTRGDNS